MKLRVLGAALAVLGLALAVPEGAAAQATGLPVYNNGVPSGLGLYLDAGIPNDAAGGGYALGASGRLGFGIFGATATLSRLDPDGAGDDIWSGGATANMKVFGGPLVPLSVTLQAGAGYRSSEFANVIGGPAEDVSQWHFPVGVGIALSVPSPAFSLKPWIAPRLDITRVSTDDLSNTSTDFGLSLGVELNTVGGFGVHAAYDWVATDGDKPGILGVGMHYGFRVPGL